MASSSTAPGSSVYQTRDLAGTASWCFGPAASRLLQQTRPHRFAWTPVSPSRRRETLPSSNATGDERGIKAEARAVLLRSIALARHWLGEVLSDSTLDRIAARERARAAIDARLPRGINVRRIAEPE